MANHKIPYAVFALNKKEAEDVIKELRKKNKDKLAEWLEDNKDEIYSDDRDLWKPFKSQNIAKLISNTNYVSNTLLISKVIEGSAKRAVLRSVEVFFIDMFATFLDKYRDLAENLDMYLGEAERGKCCFLMHYALSEEIQDELEKECRNAWEGVYDDYENGCLHRIAARVDDLKNFRNYLLKISKDRPSNVAMQALDERGWEQKPLSRLGGS